MPDPIRILEAALAAAVTAAAALLLCGWRRSPPARANAGSVLGVAMGFFLGCWVLGMQPRLSLAEDQDRLLLVLFPALIGVEFVAALPGRIRWLGWPLRLVVAAGAARVLLHHTSYLADLAGPGSREWTAEQAWQILAGLAAVLAVVWASLVFLVRRTHSLAIPLALAVASAGAGAAVMLSGYASGGQIGAPLAAALVGAVVASLYLSAPLDATGLVSMGVVGLFGLLAVGRFFGQLSTVNAALLFFAPLLCFFPELPFVRRLGPGYSGVVRVVLTAAPVVVVLVLAQQAFVRDSQPPSPAAKEASVEDYLSFGN